MSENKKIKNSSKNKKLKIAAGIAVSFIGIVVVIIYLSVKQLVSFQVATLMLVALLGLYVGFGILFAVYRLITKLE